MADLATVTDNYFAVASETYSNNLSASISSLAATVPVNSAADYDDGDVVTLVVEPGTTNEAVFTGVKASSPERFIDCKWTEGNLGVGHSSGATVVDYVTATHLSMMTKGIKVAHNDDGTLKTSAVQQALNISQAVPSDYTTLAQTATTVVPNGNRSYTMTFPGVNYTDRLSPGMRLRTERSTAAPTKSASLNGTNQYFSKSAPVGMTFTDDFVVSAWIKMDRQSGSMAIMSRSNTTNGWLFFVNNEGQVVLSGYNGAAPNYRRVISSQSVPLNKWVHITAQLDMSAFTATSTTNYVMIDGVDVPVTLASSGTNPTSLVQAGNLEIGSFSGGTIPFPGKIAQAAVFSAKVTQATMRGYMSQGILGTETSLISAFSLSNSLTDLNVTNANNLTANGGATTTNEDSPFGGQGNETINEKIDYGIIQKVAYASPDTTVTVQVPEGCTIPTSGGVAGVSYSTMRSPFGFPGDKSKWRITAYLKAGQAQSSPVSGARYNMGGYRIDVPIGVWRLGFNINISGVVSAGAETKVSLSQDVGNHNPELFSYNYANATHIITQTTQESDISVGAQARYYAVASLSGTSPALLEFSRNNAAASILYADNAYI